MSGRTMKMMEIDEWLANSRLNANLEEHLLEFGIEVMEDLDDLFKDEGLLRKCEAGMSKEDFTHFVEAYQRYATKASHDDISVNSDSWAEVDSRSSSSTCSSPKRKLQNLTLSGPNTEESFKRDQEAKHDKRKRRISAMDKKLTKAASMDLLIMLDCTGSMQPFIEAAKTRIRTFVKTIGQTYPDIPLRIGFIGYRDISDGPERVVALPFQQDLKAFERQLAGMHAFGGGNPLTDLTGALRLAAEQDWSSAIRVLFHIGDYPCHGAEYHDNLWDAYPTGDPEGLQPCEFVQALSVAKVNYCFGQLTHYTDKMIAVFNKHMDKEYIKSAPMNSTTMMEVITSSVTALLTTSLSSSSSTDSSSSVHPRECSLVPEMPAWPAVPTERAVSFSLLRVSSVEQLASEDEEKMVDDFPDAAPVYIKCAEHPFGKGRSKLAYYTQVMVNQQDTACPAAIRPVRVLKESVYSSKIYATKEKFEEFLAPQRAALYLASVYDKLRPAGTPSIEFVATRLLQFLARPGKPYFFEETFIPGEWERYNNNTGYCAPFPTALGTDHRTVQAFSHWTHHVSGGRLMITDCQGCFDAARNAFVLTDPAVHSVSLLAYGGTNMGKKGFERFFKTHRCNDVCCALGLIPQAVPVSVTEVVK